MTVSAGSANRFARRVWARRWSRVRVLLVAALVVGTAAAGVWAVWFSGLFAVRDVEVSGTGRLTQAQVLTAAAVPAGTPLARLDTAAVARRVRGLAPVRSVEVVRSWPRAVVITVQERVPAAVVTRGAAYGLVDRAGVVFDTVPRRPNGMPLVSAPSGAGVPELRAALAVLAATPPAVRAQVREVRALTPDHVRLLLTRHRTVVWGSAERPERKASVLTALMTRKASVYDVSAPDAPTTRR